MTLKVARTTLKMYKEGRVRNPSSRKAPTQELDRGSCLMILRAPDDPPSDDVSYSRSLNVFAFRLYT